MKSHQRRRYIVASWCLLLFGVASCVRSSNAAEGASKASTYTGCVTPLSGVADAYVLATTDRCLLLEGKYDASRSSDHTATFKGLVTDAAGLHPDTLHVDSLTSVKEACARTCTLEPPGTRGLHGKEKPGKEGGTPGVHQDPPQR